MRKLNSDTLCGKSQQGLELYQDGCFLHPAMVADWNRLKRDAAKQGFDLTIASGFRSYYRQEIIWNAKYKGERPVFNEAGEFVDFSHASDEQKLKLIMRFSAIPGTSRHHWGSDIDVYDKAAMPEDYCLQLKPDEYAPSGIFCDMTQWLDTVIASGKSYGFFRPYSDQRQACLGIANEPWHLSYAPISSIFQQAFTRDRWRTLLVQQHFAGKDLVLDRLDELFENYLHIPSEVYPAAWAGLLC